MGNVLLFIITMAIIILMIYFMYKATKKETTPAEKIACFILVIIELTILTIFYLDRYNIPTELEWNINVDTQSWLSLIGTYVTEIIGASIGVIASVFITIYQIKENNKQNEERDRQNAKIQNMPILKYNMNTQREESVKFKNMLAIKDGIAYPLGISLKNVGMNTIRNLKVDLEVDNKTFNLIGGNSQQPLEKSEAKSVYRWLILPCEDNEYEMKLKILYQDILTNWYMQEVEIKYSTTNICSNGEYQSFVNYIVKEERELE